MTAAPAWMAGAARASSTSSAEETAIGGRLAHARAAAREDLPECVEHGFARARSRRRPRFSGDPDAALPLTGARHRDRPALRRPRPRCDGDPRAGPHPDRQRPRRGGDGAARRGDDLGGRRRAGRLLHRRHLLQRHRGLSGARRRPARRRVERRGAAWCESIPPDAPFPGSAGSTAPEVASLRGAWPEAEAEAVRATEELLSFNPALAARGALRDRRDAPTPRRPRRRRGGVRAGARARVRPAARARAAAAGPGEGRRRARGAAARDRGAARRAARSAPGSWRRRWRSRSPPGHRRRASGRRRAGRDRRARRHARARGVGRTARGRARGCRRRRGRGARRLAARARPWQELRLPYETALGADGLRRALRARRARGGRGAGAARGARRRSSGSAPPPTRPRSRALLAGRTSCRPGSRRARPRCSAWWPPGRRTATSPWSS